MSTAIFLFRTHKINLTNLAIAMAIENAVDYVYNPCRYEIVSGFFVPRVGKFAMELVDQPDVNFRDINWVNNLSLLDRNVSRAQNEGKVLIFGTHSDEQLKFLKKTYNNKIKTIAVNYSPNMYLFMLESIASYHLHLITNNMVDSNQSTEIHSLSHYMSEFDRLELIPKCSKTVADYEIPVDDFYSLDKMSSHYSEIGLPVTEESVKYYTSWSSSLPTR